MQQHSGDVPRLSEVAVRQLLSLQRLSSETDPSVQMVISQRLRKYMRALDPGSGDRVAGLIKTLQQEGSRHDSEALIRSGVKYFGSNEELQRLYNALDT
jgi:U3 small nucleolar RNA-associated protein 6